MDIAGLGQVALPAGFRVLGSWQLQPGRAQFLTASGGELYWLTDGRHRVPVESASTHRVERLDPTSSRIVTVADSGAGVFGAIAATADSVVVVSEPPLPATACGGHVGSLGGGCARPTFELLGPGGTTEQLATSDPQTETAFGGYSLDQVTPGVLLETVRHGRTVAASVPSDRASMHDIGVIPATDGLTTVGSNLVGQYDGERSMWTTGPPLPAGAAHGGIDPTGSPTHLAWYTQSPSGSDDVYVATLHGNSYGAPIRIAAESDVGVLEWASDCVLLVREFTGLFAVHVCEHGAPVTRILTANQVARIYNPARFAITPGRFAFAVHTPDAEVVVLLAVPTT